MAVFARVLEATRANQNVMSRLRECASGALSTASGRFARVRKLPWKPRL